VAQKGEEMTGVTHEKPRPIISPVGGVYTSEEAAEILRTSRRTVQRMIREGKLKAHKVGRAWRVLARDIEAFFAEQESGTEEHPA
jgi:excisionase family DNA binding protein